MLSNKGEERCPFVFPTCINAHTKRVEETKANEAHNVDYGALYSQHCEMKSFFGFNIQLMYSQ